MLRRTFVLHPIGYVGHVVHCGASGVRNVNTLFFLLGWRWYRFQKKVHRDTLPQTCVFASFRICGSRCAFWCIRCVKHQHIIFLARVGPVQNAEKLRRDTLR
jgi:hypothetical protein